MLTWNLDDDNGNNQPDVGESPIKGEDDLIELKLHQVAPVSLRGDFTLSFDIGRIRVWKTIDKTGAVSPGTTRLEASETHSLFVEGIFEASDELNDIAISARFEPAAEENYRIAGVEAVGQVNVAIAVAGLTAFRPQTGNGTYAPFQRTQVADDAESDAKLGPGIRVNSDDDNNNGIQDRLEDNPIGNENDLIEVVVSRPTLEDIEVVVGRSSQFARLWTASDRSQQIEFNPTTDKTEPLEFDGNDSVTVWVEMTGHGVKTFDLELQDGENDMVFDTLTFHRFESITLAILGEFQAPVSPAPAGMGLMRWATEQYDAGYDVMVYDEADWGAPLTTWMWLDLLQRYCRKLCS